MSQFLQKAAIERELKLHDLFKEWGQRTRAVRKLQANITAHNTVDAKASLLARLSRWFMQLTFLKHKESDTLSQICDIERKHKLLRKQKKLSVAQVNKAEQPEAKANKKSNLWLWIVLFMLLRNKKKRRPFLALQNG